MYEAKEPGQVVSLSGIAAGVRNAACWQGRWQEGGDRDQARACAPAREDALARVAVRPLGRVRPGTLAGRKGLVTKCACACACVQARVRALQRGVASARTA